jgi:hypothetical protein
LFKVGSRGSSAIRTFRSATWRSHTLLIEDGGHLDADWMDLLHTRSDYEMWIDHRRFGIEGVAPDVDLVVLSLAASGRDSVELCEALRRDGYLGRILVVAGRPTAELDRVTALAVPGRPRREPNNGTGALMIQPSSEYDHGLSMVASASDSLDAAELEHWLFGGWAVDLWVGRLTRPHDDIDVLVWRHDENRIHEALEEAGWVHAPTPEDLVGTNYVSDGYELQLTFVVPGPDGGVVVPVPEQPIVLSSGPLAFERRKLNDVSVRVLTLEMMLAAKSTPRVDEVGGAKDRADLEALRSVAESAP